MTKPLALLVPGLDGTGLLYYRQTRPLEEVYRVLAWRFRPRSEFGFRDLVEELDEACRNEEPGSMLVAGESFGGTVAIHFALAHPERVGRLVLINTFARYRRRVRISLACRLSPLLRAGGIRRFKNFVVDRTLALEGILPEDRKRYREIIQQVYQPAYCRRLALVRDVDLRPRLAEIKIPTLLFASGRDKIVESTAEARRMSAAIRNARLFEFPNAGHALLLTPGFNLAEYLDQETDC